MNVVRCFLVSVLVCFSLSAGAQTPEGDDSNQPAEAPTEMRRSVFGTAPGKGVMVAPVVRVTGFDSQGAVTIGGRVGWVFHHALVLGFEGHGVASPSVWHPDQQQVLSMNYQGLFADLILGSSRPLHGSVHLFTGFGEAHYRSSEDRSNLSEVTPLWVVEMQATVNYAPLSWMRIQAGPGFRVAPGGSLSSVSGTGFWAPYGEISVALGLF